jgi:2'-5' RNA ligase
MDADRVFSDPDLLTGRLFFAVPVPGASRAPLEAALPEVARALPEARVAAPSGWHLTLAFLGQVRPEFSSEVVTVGEAAVAGVGPAVLQLQGAGAFPNQHKARVLWAGVAGDVEVLARLAGNLAAACRAAGLRVEEREFRPHLTLARFPAPGPVPEPLPDLLAAATSACPPWEARGLCCYRSTLTNRGARYQVVRTFLLTRSGPLLT